MNGEVNNTENNKKKNLLTTLTKGIIRATLKNQKQNKISSMECFNRRCHKNRFYSPINE